MQATSHEDYSAQLASNLVEFTSKATCELYFTQDMLDEALLRPGRLEVHVEIGLPDDKGRLQILKVRHPASTRPV